MMKIKVLIINYAIIYFQGLHDVINNHMWSKRQMHLKILQLVWGGAYPTRPEQAIWN